MREQIKHLANILQTSFIFILTATAKKIIIKVLTRLSEMTTNELG